MGTATILIVDNEPKDRRLLEVLLEPEGYITVSAADGRGALAAVAEHSIDLILLDVMMPGMSGYEVADVLKADPLTSSIPIIMVSARIDHESRLAGLESGVDEFLTKPVDRTELWLRVRSLLRGKKYADQLAGHSAELEQKIAEASADLHRFRMAMDATVDAIILADRTTMKFVEVNGTASRMLGYSREELLALTPGDLYAASDDVLEAGFDAVIAGDSAATQATVQLRRKDGSYFPAEVHTHAHLSGDDWIIVAVLHDVTEREEANKRLQHLAHNDSLTGLPNRALFHKTLEQATALASNRRWTMAVMFLDLDQFKNINDTLGHAFGDALLVQVAQRLLQCVRLRDTVGRLGGDEFGLIVSMESGHEDAAQVAGNVREALRAPFIVAGEELQVTASIGISMHPQDSSEVETLIKYADTAMYRAKQAGRDTFRFFTPQMNAELITRLSLESALREAVEKQQFVLHYQPKVQISSGRIVGVEALLRWDRPGHGLIPPNDFIPALESTGLITEVGGWVIDESCRQIAEWSASTVGPMKVAVNVSGRQVLDGDVNARVGAALAAHGVAGGMLELELTESSLMEDTSNTIATLNDLKAQGVQLSIDDFGTGYSCLEYLRRFPIDKLKIDIAFVRHVIENPDDAAIVRTIIQMAHSLKLEVVAEGVETRDQLGYLAWQGCDQIQGYLVSRPLPAGDLNTLLTQGSGILVPAPSTTEASSPMPSRVLARQG